MAALKVKVQPFCEPVSLQMVKDHLRVTLCDDDALISAYISAARISCEIFTRRRFINTTLAQFLDSFPYYTDTVMSQAAYPPSYYSLPRYSTTLWNYSQMIKLFYSPLAPNSPVTIRYIDSEDSAWHTLTGTSDVANLSPTGDFLVDVASEPPRLFPQAGQYWPSVLYVPNAVEIDHVVGYNDDAAIAAAVETFSAGSPVPSGADIAAYQSTLRQADIPKTIQIAIMLMVGGWYENRESISPDKSYELPLGLQHLLWNERVEDLQPTRG